MRVYQFRHLGSQEQVFIYLYLLKKSIRAENETRTRDPNLGKVVLYQLSYFRNNNSFLFQEIISNIM